MKKRLIKTLCICFTVVYFAAYAMGQDKTATFNYIPCAPILDGNPTDEVWSDDLVTEIIPELFFDVEQPSVTASVKIFWNDSAFCILIIGSDNIWRPSWVTGVESWNSDVTELYFDVNEVLDDGLGGCTRGIGHWQVAPDFSQDQQTQKLGEVPSSEAIFWYADWYDGGGNYAREFIIPFEHCLLDKDNNPFDPTTRKEIGFDVTIIDNDAGGVRNRLVWANSVEPESCSNMNNCGVITIAGDPDDTKWDSFVCPGATAIKNISNNSQIKAYIADDLLVVEGINDINETVTIFDITGRVVLSVTVTSREISVPVRTLQCGVYFVTLEKAAKSIKIINM